MAEKLLAAVAGTSSIPSEPVQAVMVHIAQAHATLALAAATAIAQNGDMPARDSDLWIDVAGVRL